MSFSFSIDREDTNPLSKPWGDPFPKYNIEDSEKYYIYYIDVPGVNKKDIKIAITDNIINISGERKYILNDEGSNYIYSESKYNVFSRDITVKNNCNLDNCRAKLNNGVLELKIEKIL